VYAIESGDADVIAAAITACSAIVVTVVGIQWKVHRDNRRDHGDTAAKVDRLLDHQSEIQRDVQYIRADVTDLHGAITELRKVDNESHARITKLERKQPRGDDAA
jgi:peptidoglycan hydrolase CwlO-like protein